jgi:hypothetical protein
MLGEVELGEAEVAEVVGDEGVEDGFAAALVEEDFVAGEDVAGLEAVEFSEAASISATKRSVAAKPTPERWVLIVGASVRGLCRKCIGFRIPALRLRMRWKTGAGLG